MYAELVRLHREEGLSFANVVTFNLDEYYPIEKDAYQSYWSFMHRHLLIMWILTLRIFTCPTVNCQKIK